MLNKLRTLTTTQLHAIAAILAIMTAWRVIYIQHGWINDDTVLYLESARAFSLGDWKTGCDLFPWPFYALLITALHKLTTFNFQLCAQILNVIFFAISTISFLRIIALAGGNKITLICGALLLFSTTYIVGDVLPMLLRDQGFWACFLTSLVFFIQYYRDQQLKHALGWQVFALLAVLFRIEAAMYIIFLPLSLWFLPETTFIKKSKLFFNANFLNISLAVLGLIAMAMYEKSLTDFGRLQEIFYSFSQIKDNFSQLLATKTHVLATQVLGNFLKDYAWMSLILTFISISIIKSLTVAGWAALGLVTAYWSKIKKLIAKDVWRNLCVVAALAFINAVLIIFKVNLLSGRYVVSFGFILLVFAAFGLQLLVEKWQAKQLTTIEEIGLPIVTLVIAVGFSTNIAPKGSNYNYEQQAVTYMQQQKIPNDKVFFVSPRARFYAGAPYTTRGYDYWDYIQTAIKNDSIKQYDYLLLNLKVDEDHKIQLALLQQQLPGYQLEKEFFGYKNKKEIIIYKKSPNKQSFTSSN